MPLLSYEKEQLSHVQPSMKKCIKWLHHRTQVWWLIILRDARWGILVAYLRDVAVFIHGNQGDTGRGILVAFLTYYMLQLLLTAIRAIQGGVFVQLRVVADSIA